MGDWNIDPLVIRKRVPKASALKSEQVSLGKKLKKKEKERKKPRRRRPTLLLLAAARGFFLSLHACGFTIYCAEMTMFLRHLCFLGGQHSS